MGANISTNLTNNSMQLVQSSGQFSVDQLFIFFLGFLIAYTLSKTIGYLLRRFMSEFAKRTETTLDDRIVKAIDLPLTFFLIIISIVVSAKLTNLENLPIISLIIKEGIIITLAITLYNLFNAFFSWYVDEVAPKKNINIKDMEGTIKRVVAIFIIAITIIMMLDTAGIEITPLLASLGIAGLAIALAFQDTLGNFFAGLYISIDRPIREGDYVKLESGEEGNVYKIGWRSTMLRTIDNNIVVVPNSKLATTIVINYDKIEKELTLVIPTSVSYDSDLEKVEKVAKKTMQELIAKHDFFVKNYEPLIRFSSFGDSGINLNIIVRVIEFKYKFIATSETIKEIHKAFKKNGIEIPYPKREVYLKKVK
ncbi:MAG: mechanosensitive ion channel family protein [Candidatus Micrarchaeota archaeon]|nr:mechanosensitive ion channel family protein [Candidatus Micrarchaeota archaeon]